MTTRGDLKDFLVANIPSQVSTFKLAAEDVWSGQSERISGAPFDVQVRSGQRIPLEREAGKLARHIVEITIRAWHWDASEEETLTRKLEDAAEELVDFYDENINIFRTNLSTAVLSWVRCSRGDIVMDSTSKRSITVALFLDEWVN